MGTADPTRRGGAALIVVMALLGTLAFLGLLFYAFAAQELASAQNFATAPPPTYPPTMYEDFALEQLLRGTRPSLADSALYGSNWAIIPNMIGRPNFDEKLSLSNPNNAAGNRFADVNPFDGLGIGVWADASNQGALGNGEFIFDYTGEGAPDADETDFRLNFSRPANPGPDPWIPPIETFAFHPDAGYTYPDVNSLFLAFDGFVRDPNNPNNVYRVIIPSFHRPQYFPFKRFAQGAPNPAGFGDIFIDPNTVDKVLRPHANHIAGVASVDIPPYYNAGDPIPRFYGAVGGIQAQSGDTTRTIPPFAFLININSNPNDVDSNGAPVINQAGVWSIADVPVDPNRPGSQFPTSTVYEFDVDNDGDGFRDSIWMDLDHAILDMPDGRQFVPLFAFKVIDLDGLLNVNAHGNMNGALPPRDSADQPVYEAPVGLFGRLNNTSSMDLISASNQGLSRSEVNLGLALTANPSTDLGPNVTLESAQRQHALNVLGRSTIDDPDTPNDFEQLTPGQLSNIELLMLLNGRENWRGNEISGFVADARIEGRWGDDFLLPGQNNYQITRFYDFIRSGQIPPSDVVLAPGFPTEDDDDDSNAASVGHPLGGMAYRDPNLLDLWVPAFVHPLDYGGTGMLDYGGAELGYLEKYSERTSEGMRRRLARPTGLSAVNPSRWPDYNALQQTGLSRSPWQYQAWDAAASSVTHLAPYWSVFGGALQENNPLHDFLVDDGNEVIVSRNHSNAELDAVFATSEMDGLHLSQSDYEASGARSRLRDLAIINFDKTNEPTRRRFAGRFTTDSWDRLDFGNGQSFGGTAPRDWEFTDWNYNQPPENPDDPNDPTYDPVSAVLFVSDAATFPPEFRDPAGGGGNTNMAAGEPDDPMRQELRLLLRSEFGYSDHLNPNSGNPRFPRHRLNINRILSDESFFRPDLAAFDAEENPRFRNLTPHPNLRALEEIDPNDTMQAIVIPDMEHENLPLGTPPNLPSGEPQPPPFADLSIDPNGGGVTDPERAQLANAMEWWARYDRQRLARDIYVLLWILGGGQDDQPSTNTAGVYTLEQAKEMAQFAVNLVDAMDRDNVITHFEYDPNLTDGWDTTGASLEEVDGVEVQQLTFSEALWIRAAEVTSGSTASANDHDATLYDDSTDDHQYLFIELRNSSPFPVEFNNDSWRIRQVDATGSTVDDNVISLQRGTLATPLSVGPGNNFLIGTHDGDSLVDGGPNHGAVRSSTFRIDHDSDTSDFTYPAIAPYKLDPQVPTGTTLAQAREDYPDPLVDLDLCHTRDNTNQRFAEYYTAATMGTQAGYFLDTTFTDDEMYLVLERRHSLHGEGLIDYTSDSWGDWIEVDRVTVDSRSFNLSHDSTPSLIYNTSTGDGLTDTLISQERPEPFYAAEEPPNMLPTPEAQGLLDYTGANVLYRHTLGGPDPTFNGADPTTQPAADLNRDHQKNSQELANGGDVFTLWQPHFDRDFSSVMELLSVPLYGADEVIYRNRKSNEIEGGLSKANTFKLGNEHVAGIRFQFPAADSDFDGTPDVDADGDGMVDAHNRWYRLLEFLTTEDAGEQAARERVEDLVRTPGKVNLNTIRDEAVLAAVIDDPHIEQFNRFPLLTADRFETTRNWFKEFILARDGIDPLNHFGGNLTLPLPGVPGVPSDPVGNPNTNLPPIVQYGAVPYRSLSYVAPNLGNAWPDFANSNKAAHTLLRHHVVDPGGTLGSRPANLEQLGLFEARTSTDFGADEVDFHTRNRLLAKVANHTTTRSNVFAVWLTVGFFEAHQPDPSNPNVVQIGGEMAGMARHRAFFVVDRTRLEDAVQVDNRGTPDDLTDDIMTLDWRTFLLHRRTLPGR